jgi:uncharacterized protein YggE
MNTKLSQKLFSIAVLGTILILAVAGGWLLQADQASVSAAPLPQTQQNADNTERTLSVSGSGSVDVVPDMAIVQLGVETQADTASQALSENSDQMNGLINALESAGVSSQDIQTQRIQLQPVYQQPTSGQQNQTPPKIVGFSASNVVEVTIRNLNNLGDLLDAAVSSGGNTINSIRFQVSNPQTALDQARENAMNDAQHKAEQLASLAGVELGQVMTISESSSTPPTPVVVSAAREQAAAVPVQPGTESIQVNVQVTWELAGGQGASQ